MTPKGGFLTQYVCSLLSLVQNNNTKKKKSLNIILNETERGDLENWNGRFPQVVCSPTEAEESQRDGKEGVGGGHRSPPLLIRQRRFMWTATSCRANERTAPSTSAPSPLYSPLSFFFFCFPSQSRGRSDVDKAECGPLRAFLLLLFRVFLYIFFLSFSSFARWNISVLATSNINTLSLLIRQPTTLCINVTR
jgi:hypothetical protein